MEAVAVAATAFQALGAIQQGNAAAASYDSQANADKYNAQIASQNADIVSQQAAAQEATQRRKAALVAGEQRAAQAQSGLAFTGSALDVAQQSAANAELDALNIRYEGQLKRRGLLANAQQDSYGADVAGQNSNSAALGGYLNAGSKILGGTGNYLKTKALLKQ